MIKPQIQYNMALELIGALARYGYGKLKKSAEEKEYPLNKDIENWVDHVEKNISPFLKQDIELLIKNFLGNIVTPMNMIAKEKDHSPSEFIKRFKSISGQEYMKQCFKDHNFPEEMGIDYESSEDVIYEALVDERSEEEAKLFLQFKKQPEEMKKRLDNVLEEFYLQFVKPFEQDIEKILARKAQEHNDKILQNPKKFLEVVAYGDYSKSLEGNKPLAIYVTYFAEISFTYIREDNADVMIYGFGLEQRFHHEMNRKSITELFKALDDEKRLEILRLIGKRPWYSKELADHFGLTTATMSYHINKLMDIGVVNYEALESKRIYYKVNNDRLRELFDLALEDILGE